MPIDFPTTPAYGDEVVVTPERSWFWDNEKFVFELSTLRPRVTAILPIACGLSDAPLTVRVLGENFTNASQIVWKDAAVVPTTFVSATELTCQFDPATEADAERIPVRVHDGKLSNYLYFYALFNPTVVSMVPVSAAAGGAAFALTVNGTYFDNTTPGCFTELLWDGAPITPDSINPSPSNACSLIATITPAAAAGAHTVNIRNGPVVSGSTDLTFTYT